MTDPRDRPGADMGDEVAAAIFRKPEGSVLRVPMYMWSQIAEFDKQALNEFADKKGVILETSRF